MPGTLQGPDGSLPLNHSDGFVARIAVPTGRRLNVGFNVSGFNENDVMVYLEDTLFCVVERGNYNRSQAFWQSDPNLARAPEVYLISGWNKESPPDGGKPWRQSPATTIPVNGFTTVIDFHDLGPGSLGATVTATVAE
jgi:hypothetical protein